MAFTAASLTRKDDLGPTIISGKYGSVRHESPVNLTLARTWVKNCSSHSSCQAEASDVQPTRLLDIRDENTIKLHITSPGEILPYVALSYSWGGLSQEDGLTLESLETITKKGVKFCNLPATIKDAISVARVLEFPYIWIDWLCIIQFSDDDTIHELPKMGDIYQNAALTIVAAGSKGASEGFLDKTTLDPTDDAFDTTETRAWCLQEALMSTRCLVFSSVKMYWGCREVAYADHELQVSRLPPPENVHHFVQSLHPLLSKKYGVDTLTADDRNELWTFWVDVLSDYTYRNVTNLGDRLPAIAAIATKFHNTTDDNYCAGIWKDEIWKGLLWAVDVGDMLGQHTHYWLQKPKKFGRYSRPRYMVKMVKRKDGQVEKKRERDVGQKGVELLKAGYLAPTWSWASVSGPIHYLPSPKSQFFELVSTNIKLNDLGFPFGQLNESLQGAKDEFESSITVKGRMEHCIWTKELLVSGTGTSWLTRIDHGTFGGTAPSKVDHIWSTCVLRHIQLSLPNSRSGERSIPKPENLPSFRIGNSWFPPGSPWRNFAEATSMAPEWGAARHQAPSLTQGFPRMAEQSFSIRSPLPEEAKGYMDTWEGFTYEQDRKIEEVYCLEVGQLAGLILKPAPSPEKRGVFVRVGYFGFANGWFFTSPVEEITLI